MRWKPLFCLKSVKLSPVFCRTSIYHNISTRYSGQRRCGRRRRLVAVGDHGQYLHLPRMNSFVREYQFRETDKALLPKRSPAARLGPETWHSHTSPFQRPCYSARTAYHGAQGLHCMSPRSRERARHPTTSLSGRTAIPCFTLLRTMFRVFRSICRVRQLSNVDTGSAATLSHSIG